MKTSNILTGIVLSMPLIACRHIGTDIEPAATTLPLESQTFAESLYASGGIYSGGELCPKSPLDTITPITALDPEPAEGVPEMSVTGLQAFIQEHRITTIDALLNHFPDHYRTNFSLVEHTRATGQSSLQFPRIVLFGSDGRFMLNVGTKPDDPKYDLLDVAELDTDTGRWEFSVFDFSKSKPTLSRNDASCIECHGNNNSRPIWGTFQKWTGVFGDSIIDGPRPEALDHTHAFKMNDIILGEGGSNRFDFLLWEPIPLRRGGVRHIAHHDFGPELLLSNIAFGSATALGAWLRLSQLQPEAYKQQRYRLLLAYYLHRTQKQQHFVKVTHSEASLVYAADMKLRIQTLLDKAGTDASLDQQLSALGLETSEAFSLATLHQTEAPDTTWSMAAADLYDLLMLQILDDLSRDDPTVQEILAQTSARDGVFQCPDTADTIADLVQFKMLHLFQLAGESRYKVNWVYYPKDVEDTYEQVFLPIAQRLIPHLKDDDASNVAMHKVL